MGSGSVTIDMYFRTTIRTREVASRFFDIFRSIFSELEFKLMGEWEPLRQTFDINQAIEEWVENRGGSSCVQFGRYTFSGEQPAPFHAFSNWQELGTHKRWLDFISIVLDEGFWLDRKLRDPSGRTIRLFKHLSTSGDSLYGRVFHSSEFETKDFRERVLKDGRVSRESISLTPREGIVDLFWANYFGKPYVTLFGEDSLKRIKSTVNEKFDSGFLLVFGSDPFMWEDEKVLSLQMMAKTELDHGAFLDKAADFRPNLRIASETSVANSSTQKFGSTNADSSD